MIDDVTATVLLQKEDGKEWVYEYGIGRKRVVYKHCGWSFSFTMLGSRLRRLGVWSKEMGDIPGCYALLGSLGLLLYWYLFSNRFPTLSSMNIN